MTLDRPNPQTQVTIIGAGLSGLTLALGLLRHNIAVQIFEAAPKFKSESFGISIGPAAHRALPLIDPRISDAYNALVTTHSDSPGYERFCRTWFEFVWAISDRNGEALMNLEADNLGQTSVHRGNFLAALMSSLPPGVVRFGKSLVDLQETAEGIMLNFKDGSAALTDVVIGCDGIHSRVRSIVIPGGLITPKYSGMYAYRAVLDMAAMIDAVGERRARVATMYVGEGAYVVTYPIMRAKQVNVGFFKRSTHWDHKTWVRSASMGDMLQDFGHMGEAVKSIMRYMKEPVQWAIFENPPVSTYARGCVAIIGDAAHASTPHQGAGAGQAIEDVHVLTELLGDGGVLNRTKAKAAFQAYDRVRRPRSQWVVDTSSDMGRILSLSLDDAHKSESIFKETVKDRLATLWNLDVPAQAEAARSIMIEDFLDKTLDIVQSLDVGQVTSSA